MSIATDVDTLAVDTGQPPPRRTALGALFACFALTPLFSPTAIFAGQALMPTPDNVLGAVSLLLWSLALVAGLLHLGLLLSASHEGEGGAMAMLALVLRGVARSTRLRQAATVLGLLGVALMVTQVVLLPALTIRSALSGLATVLPEWRPVATTPIALLVTTLVFLLQRKRFPGLSRGFGPIVAAWLLLIAALGVRAILAAPGILAAFDPRQAVAFLARNGAAGTPALGAAVLGLAGLDLVHGGIGSFGARRLRDVGIATILAVGLCDLGQGAAMLHDPHAVDQALYRLVPAPWLPPFAALAALVAAIAVRSHLSGVSSVLREAARLSYLPRLHVVRATDDPHRHVFLPAINGLLLVLALGALLELPHPDQLLAAYALATAASLLTTIALVGLVAQWQWHWHPALIGLLALSLGGAAFTLGAAAVAHAPLSAWMAPVLAAAVLALMLIWRDGRDRLLSRTTADSLPLDSFCASIAAHPPSRVDRTAVFLTARPQQVPQPLLSNLAHNHILHQRVLILTVETVDAPTARDEERLQVDALGNGFYRVRLRFGFAEAVNVPAALARWAPAELRINSRTAYFLGHEVITALRKGVRGLRQRLFALMARNAYPAHASFRIPSNQLIEIGQRWDV